MPLYDYRCTKCGREWEGEHRLGEDAAPCDVCGGEAEIVISSPSVNIVDGNVGKPITDMRQVEASHGANWRDRGTPDPTSEGGGRKRIYSK